jgi:hypothetical protein
MITILSDNGGFKARVDEGDDGVTVTFWRRLRLTGDGPVWMLICAQTIDIAFHVMCDFAHDTVNELVEPSMSQPTPAQKLRRLLSIIR